MARLTEQDWLDHGLKTLARSGFTSLKAATLAQELRVTRGSFYWHFKDIAAYKTRLLKHWQARTTDAIIRELDTQNAKAERLPDLMVRSYAARPGLDRAVRVWAKNDDQARAHLKMVDTLRIGYIQKLLMSEGLGEATACLRARFLYAASLGDQDIAPGAAAPFSEANLKRLATLLISSSPDP